MPHPKYEIRKAKNGQYYFTLTGKNGQVILQSGMNDTKESALEAIEMMRACVEPVEVDLREMKFDLFGAFAIHNEVRCDGFNSAIQRVISKYAGQTIRIKGGNK